MRLVVDMNLSQDWISALSSAGIDAIHWNAIGAEDAPDDAIMAWAVANDAVILTRDLDFSASLMREARSAPSVIQLRIDQVRASAHVPLVLDALDRHRTHLERGAVVTLEGRRVRVRRLGDDIQI